MRTAVVIATTKGPVPITLFTHDPGLSHGSMMAVQDGEDAGVSRLGQVTPFIDRRGRRVLERFGLESLPGAMLMEVSADIESGRSWELGTLAAMVLSAKGLFEPNGNKAERILFCSGEVADATGTIKPVGALADKLHTAMPAIHKRVVATDWLIPAEQLAEIDQIELPKHANLVPVETLAETIQVLLPNGVADRQPTALAQTPSPQTNTLLKPPLKSIRRSWLLLAVLLLLSVALTVVWQRRDIEPEILKQPAADLWLAKRQAPMEMSCLVLNFQNRKPEFIRFPNLPNSGELPSLSGDSRLCGIEVEVVPTIDNVPIFVFLRVEIEPKGAAQQILPRQLDGLHPLDDIARLSLIFDAQAKQVDYRLLLISGTQPVPDEANLLFNDPRHALADKLRSQGYTVRHLSQSIQRP